MESIEELRRELEKERAARIKAEEKFLESTIAANRLNNLILTIQSGVMVEDENRKILLVNQHFCDIFGIPFDPKEMIGWDCSESAEQTKHLFVDPEGFVAQINILLFDKKQVLGEELFLGDGRCFSRDYVPVFLGGDYHGHLWNYSDITARKRSEIMLRRREEKYRRIIENMNIGLLEVDLKGKIRYANQSFCAMSGYCTDELKGVVAEDLFMKDKDADRNTILEKHKARQDGQYDAYEVNVTNRTGESKWWLISGAPMYDDDGIVIGSIGIHLDITLQKDLEFNLTEAKKFAEETAHAKEVFLANMSHEIRTPMNAILGLGKQLLKTPLDSQQESFLKAINTAADNLIVIINDILDFSKIEAGKMPLEKIGFNMKGLCMQVERILSQNAKSKGLDFIIEADETIAPVLIGDPFRVNQVLLNLISNSIKFPEKGNIRLSCHVLNTTETHQELMISVEDTGIGIDKKYLKSIFQKFTQENVNMARKFGGTGLGMAITQQLVGLMKGTITIDSIKGSGTKIDIRITFPKGQKSDLPVQEKVPANIEELRNKKILLVEDNQINRLVARSILKIYGVQVTEASDGQIAVDLLKSSNFDIVLMDMQMPVMDGLEATRIIRAEVNSTIPIIALTANALKGEQDKCMEAGMNDFISKPFDESRLLEVILKYLP
ncbi:MAG: response regulator [Bacteroidota bacterium]